MFGVKSISFSKSYSNCVECVRDPHCGWDREQGTCQGFQSHLLQDPMGEVDGICEASLNRQKIVAWKSSWLFYMNYRLSGNFKYDC